MVHLTQYLKLLQIPYHVFGDQNRVTLPLPIQGDLNLKPQNNYLIYYRRIVFYALLPLNEKKTLLMGPITSHRVLGMETFEIFFCYNSSERYRQLKDQLEREPLTNYDDFHQMLKMVIQDYHLPYKTLKSKELKKSPKKTYNFTQMPNQEIQKEVITAIRFGNIDQLVRILDNPAIFSNSVINAQNPPKQDLQYFYFSALSKFNDIAAEAGVSQSVRDHFTDNYTKLWQDPTLDAKKIGHLLVNAMIDTAQECRQTIYFPDNDPLLNHVLRFVSNHVNEKISRESIATALNLSPSYLSHYFKDKADMTVSHFINLYKTNHAKYLLATTNRSITDIAESLSFSNVSYFNRIFSKIAHQTPSAFRKEIMLKARFAPNDEG